MGPSAVVLVSGGIDSAVLAWHLLGRYRRVVPVYVREGMVWEEAELLHLRRFLAAIGGFEPLHVVDVPMADVMPGHWSLSGADVPDAESAPEAVYLPGRNLILLGKAAVLAARMEVDTLALGLLAGNPFPDATPAFLEAMASAASLAMGRSIRIEAPFRSMSKLQVLQLGAGLPLELTFSCLAPQGDRPCGRCNKCAERQQAFRAAGRADPTPYVAATR